MDATALAAAITGAVPAATIEVAPSVDLHMTLYVSRADLPAVARLLRERADLAFDFLAEVTAADYWPREPRYELVYVLVSIPNRLRLRLKVRLNADDPHVATVCRIW